jgi:VanZ family protein
MRKKGSVVVDCGMVARVSSRRGAHLALVEDVAMRTKFRLGWLQAFGVVAFALVIYASLMLPDQLERMRTGHWFTEHFVGYFVASLIICLGWRRRFFVASGLTVTAFALEGLQALTPNHSANLLSVLGGASGAWLAALSVEAFKLVSNRGKSASS